MLSKRAGPFDRLFLGLLLPSFCLFVFVFVFCFCFFVNALKKNMHKKRKGWKRNMAIHTRETEAEAGGNQRAPLGGQFWNPA